MGVTVMDRDDLNELRENSKNDDQVVEILFDKINDFEIRICENYKHGGENYYIGGCPIDYAIWDSCILGVDFGCTEFKRMEDGS